MNVHSMFFSPSKFVVPKAQRFEYLTYSLFSPMPLRFSVVVILKYLDDFKMTALINN